jgi:hypothetical protein
MGTGTIASKAVDAVAADATMVGVPSIMGGSARITAPSGVYCVAYVVDTVDPPTLMMRLPIIKKTNQKGD